MARMEQIHRDRDYGPSTVSGNYGRQRALHGHEASEIAHNFLLRVAYRKLMVSANSIPRACMVIKLPILCLGSIPLTRRADPSNVASTQILRGIAPCLPE